MGTPPSFDDISPALNSAQVAEMLLIGRVDSVQRMAREVSPPTGNPAPDGGGSTGTS